MGLRGFSQSFAHPELSESSVKMHQLGTCAYDSIGNKYRYVKAGAAALVAGNVIQSPAWPSDQVNLAVAANAAIGATSISVTNGGSGAITAGQYADGQLIVETTPGEGYSYRITSNSAAGTSATITLIIEGGLKVALTAAGSKVSLHLNMYNGVIQSPVTTLTGAIVGVAVYPITAAYYGWIGCHGSFGTLIAGTPALGSMVTAPATAAGALVIHSAELMSVGVMRVTGVDGKVKAVQWLLG